MKNIDLTEEQKKAILDLWNKCVKEKQEESLSLKSCVEAAFPGKNYDGRSAQGRAVKSFLASRKLKYEAAAPKIRDNTVELTDDQKEFIANNHSSASSFEMARTFWPERKISSNCYEVKAINDYKSSLPNQIKQGTPENKEEGGYSPPKSVNGLIPLVNRYCNTDYIKEDKLKEIERKNLKTLLGHMNGFSYLHKIKGFLDTQDVDLFESSFVRFCFDKYDITQEEVDLYLLLCAELVNKDNLDKYEQDLRDRLESKLDDNSTQNVKAITDAINNAQQKCNESLKQIRELTKYLETQRKERLKSRGAGYADMTKILEQWQFEESRKDLIRIAKLQKELEVEEIGRLNSLDDTIALIMGATEEELLHG